MIEKIMVVDDDPSILDALITVLEMKGYEVIGASSGRECLDKLDGVGVVFLDIRMPGMDGIQVLKEIKKRKPSMQVIMLTAFATVDTAIEAMKEGAIDYLRKPFEMEELEECILGAVEEMKFDEMKPTFEEQGYIEKFEELSKNGKGLLIAKDRGAKEKYGLDDESFIWLTDEYGKDAVNPRKISDLKSKIEEFVEKNAKAVILLSNMEYLIKKNSLIEVWEFVKDLYGKISSKATMMISANLEKMDEEMAKEIEDLMSDIRLGSISNSISNYLRRRIISSLSNGKREFTKIARSLGIKDHPKLSFHLKKLKEDGIIQQDEDKKYLLTKTGEDVAKILDEMKRHGVGKEKNLIWIPVKRVKS